MVSDTNGSTTIDDECSPLSSTMRRISKIMSGISMERDSGNSSPTTEFASNYKVNVITYLLLSDVIVFSTNTTTLLKFQKQTKPPSPTSQ